MLFNSYIYPIFLLLAVLLYWLAVPARYRVFALIIFGILFYAYYDIRYLFLIVALALFTYFSASFLLKKQRKSLFIFALSALILSLIFFKYFNLLLSTANRFGTDFSLLNIIMPLGISFFTFEFIHYLADVYKGLIKENNFFTFLSFALFFPSLVSGPIKRFEKFADQTKEITFKPAYLYYGGILLLLGYSQKYFIADNLVGATQSLASPNNLGSSFSIFKSLYFYSFRIYFDFSGMSHIAIGSGLLFGILIPKNFSYPYLSGNISEFWERWHMSLSKWVRDYLFIPLGGSRAGSVRLLFNLIAVMFIIGLWHGANWNFAIWGLWHGLGLVIYHLYAKIRPKFNLAAGWRYLYKIFGIIFTFNFVSVGWIFFITPTFNDSMIVFSKIFRL